MTPNNTRLIKVAFPLKQMSLSSVFLPIVGVMCWVHMEGNSRRYFFQRI